MSRELERRWSRFLDTSEVSALNQHAGYPVIVSADTFELVERSLTAWRLTGGRFDPTVGAALIAHGYDRDFAEIATAVVPVVTRLAGARAPPASSSIPVIDAVTLPAGVTFDPGGIGKGLAADLTAAALIHAGAHGALVNLGGDLRALGRPPAPEGWAVTVADPLDPDRELLRLAMPHGAVATSSRLRRRWQTTAGEAHHLIDPATGRPADTDVVAVTVVAGEAWWAEALTKALFLLGPPGLDALDDVHAVVVTADGRRHATPDLERRCDEPADLVVPRPSQRPTSPGACSSASVMSGLLLSTRLTKGRPTPAWILDLHRFLGGSAVIFTALHIAGLVADSYVHFGLADLLVPFASSWHPARSPSASSPCTCSPRSRSPPCSCAGCPGGCGTASTSPATWCSGSPPSTSFSPARTPPTRSSDGRSAWSWPASCS